ncbi:MAG: daunorubicin ABC transporter ATP-binding protein [Ardenticatenia bacterium]|nr:MAG: daunorubicin ABC transporter ATP-binding protein [Ardenticatenia bacterium]
MSDPAIVADQLVKVYPLDKSGPPLRAVDGISFEVRRGEVFGFLGPNGAGKTSTIRMLTGLSQPTSGQATVLGYNLTREITAIKKHVGVVPESSNLYDELTALENLMFAMQLYGVPRAERKARAMELLTRFRLEGKRDVLFANLSRGMKRALTVAAALAHRPALLFLDEPTTGLDVMSARSLRQMIAQLRDEGVTIFLTTHYLEEAERLCDRVAIIVRGRIVALDTVDGLKERASGRAVVEVTFLDANRCTQTRRIEAEDVAVAVRQALEQVDGAQLVALNTLRPTLEDVFVRLTGLSAEVMLAEKGGQGGGGNAGG